MLRHLRRGMADPQSTVRRCRCSIPSQERETSPLSADRESHTTTHAARLHFHPSFPYPCLYPCLFPSPSSEVRTCPAECRQPRRCWSSRGQRTFGHLAHRRGRDRSCCSKWVCSPARRRLLRVSVSHTPKRSGDRREKALTSVVVGGYGGHTAAWNVSDWVGRVSAGGCLYRSCSKCCGMAGSKHSRTLKIQHPLAVVVFAPGYSGPPHLSSGSMLSSK